MCSNSMRGLGYSTGLMGQAWSQLGCEATGTAGKEKEKADRSERANSGAGKKERQGARTSKQAEKNQRGREGGKGNLPEKESGRERER